MKEVVDRYLKPGDFNGLYLHTDVDAELVRPLREIRQARQKPAHALRTNITDKTFVQGGAAGRPE